VTVTAGPPAKECDVVLYDADCGFCRWTLAKLLAWDRGRRLRPVPIESAEGDRLLERLDRDARLASWHLVEPDGQRYSAGAAAPRLLRRLPGGGAPAALLARFPRRSEQLYAWVARNRGAFGRLVGEGAKRRADRRIARRRS
jgi:predicted DCC family thiol-disulfide oxidoreductase YuxK